MLPTPSREADEALRLASLPCVDLVVVSDGETRTELLRSFRPDLLVEWPETAQPGETDLAVAGG